MGGQAELWYGITWKDATGPNHGPRAAVLASLREELIASGDLVPVAVEGVRGRRHVLGSEVPLLKDAAAEAVGGEPMTGAGVAFLAPLDPLAWDRDLLRSLFGFDYTWEVYTPQVKRRLGYYVLPLLWGDRLVGRIEPRIDRAAGTVRILGLWWEPGFDPRVDEGFVPAMRQALGAYLRFAGVPRLEWLTRAADRRLFGVRPRG